MILLKLYWKANKIFKCVRDIFPIILDFFDEIESFTNYLDVTFSVKFSASMIFLYF